ncbi:MAG: hypothetical protein ACXU8N_17405 [Telluria sp.]
MSLEPAEGAVNRITFVINAQVRAHAGEDAEQFRVQFQPSLQQYAVLM